jgi:hypothetical protein
MPEADAKVFCVCLIETDRVVWQGVGEWEIPETEEGNERILYALMFGILAGLRAVVAPHERCNVTICCRQLDIAFWRLAIVKDSELSAAVDECAEQFEWAMVGPAGQKEVR